MKASSASLCDWFVDAVCNGEMGWKAWRVRISEMMCM